MAQQQQQGTAPPPANSAGKRATDWLSTKLLQAFRYSRREVEEIPPVALVDFMRFSQAIKDAKTLWSPQTRKCNNGILISAADL